MQLFSVQPSTKAVMDQQSSITNHINDYDLYTECLDDLPCSYQTLVHTINQYSYCMAGKDPAFKNALQGADVLLPDGVGMVLAVRFLTGKKIRKIAGADLHKHVLDSLESQKGRCFYLGSSKDTLKKIHKRISEEFPSVQVGSYSPPFKREFSEEENVQMMDVINAFRPDVLFIGMTAPKQEKWAFIHKSSIDANLICSIGAVFDFYAGTVKRPQGIWVDMGLEWFIRLLKEPKRLWKRYLYYGPVFLKDILLEKARRL